MYCEIKIKKTLLCYTIQGILRLVNSLNLTLYIIMHKFKLFSMHKFTFVYTDNSHQFYLRVFSKKKKKILLKE